jgi:hypothetical protein
MGEKLQGLNAEAQGLGGGKLYVCPLTGKHFNIKVSGKRKGQGEYTRGRWRRREGVKRFVYRRLPPHWGELPLSVSFIIIA